MIYSNGAQLPNLTDSANSCGCTTPTQECLENCAIDKLATYLDQNFGSGSTTVQEYTISDFANMEEAVKVTCGSK